MNAALALYGRGLAGEAALRLRDGDGRVSALPVARWLGPVTPADESVLARAVAPVLDVGCGPGRHVSALARRGVPALGVDVCATAVRRARDRGAPAVERSVWGRMPSPGAWRSVLLLDGNIGIGGRPRALLRRVTQIAHPEAVVLVELGRPGTPTGPTRIRLEDDASRSEWFPWAHVAADALADLAADAGLLISEEWMEEERWFAALVRR